MKLRVISGELKGRYIQIPDDIGFRPTLERTRESVAEILKKRLKRGAMAADFCAGSGAFGFEMLSRGAVSVDFVEKDKAAILRITENAKRFGVESRINVICGDVSKFVDNRAAAYDLIFYDPPYDDEKLTRLVPEILKLLKDGGVLVYERKRRHNEKKTVAIDSEKNMFDARIFSDTVVEFYESKICSCNDSDELTSSQ
ncbi:MAG: RsmD family RNA methyltransferase [Chitinispirillia bacterium]|nr:RsmD family RNA methyltransferase [Chitinispirillia bacterium]